MTLFVATVAAVVAVDAALIAAGAAEGVARGAAAVVAVFGGGEGTSSSWPWLDTKIQRTHMSNTSCPVCMQHALYHTTNNDYRQQIETAAKNLTRQTKGATSTTETTNSKNADSRQQTADGRHDNKR